MATISGTSNDKFRAVIRNAKGGYLRSTTLTRTNDACTWARRMVADQEAMEALGESGASLPSTSFTRRYMDAFEGRGTSRA